MRLILATFFVAASACATMKSDREKQDQLIESVEAYNDAFRWKNYERAAAFLPNDTRAAFVAAHEDDEKSLHVEDYSILKVDRLGDDGATITVRVRYMMLPSVTIELRNVVQHWHHVAGSWMLETEDNSIRTLDLAKTPANPDAFGGGGDGAPMEIEVTAPDGQVVRKEGDPQPLAEPEPTPEN